MGPVKCRCGGKAASKCAACGNELTGDGHCKLHPAMDTAPIHCMDCEKALCFWHYVLQPTHDQLLNRVVLKQRCFPSCAHAFRASEFRRGAA